MQYLKKAIKCSLEDHVKLTINSLIYSVFLHSCRFGRQLWFWHDNRDIQWNMGISLRTWIINVTFCGKLLFKNILADWLRQRAALMAIEKKIPHIPILCKKRKRRFLRVFHFLGAVGQKERRHIWKRFHKRLHITTQPPSNSQTPCNKTFHHLRGEKKEKICHLFWSLMVILFLSCRNLPRPESQTTMPNPPTSSKLLQFYL